MTLLVGILCRDGVVMASDSAATFGFSGTYTIGQQEVRKVVKVNPHILYSSTGAVGMGQLIVDKLKTMWDAKDFASVKSPEQAMNKIGKEILQLTGPYLQMAAQTRSVGGDAGTSFCKSLVALPINNMPLLLQFDYNGAPERATLQLPFVALGSGQAIADPFLALLKRLLWTTDGPTIAEGKLAAVWTIEHVCRTNAGGVGGNIQLAVLPSGGKPPEVTLCDENDVQEHLQRVASAEKVLVAELRGTTGTADAPPLPAPVAPPAAG